MNANTCTDSQEVMTAQRILYAYWLETKYEFLRFIRMPGYAVPTLVMPVFLYLLIGIVVIGPKAPDDPELPMFIFAAFSVFAITSPGMYGLGQAFAIERQSGVFALKRIQAVPAAAYLIAKIVSTSVCMTAVMSCLVALAISFGGITLGTAQIGQILAAGLLGMATFGALGLFIGSRVKGTSAPAVVNLIYFPMMYLSGTFFPLPEALAPWALIWPTFYLDQLLFAIILGESAVSVSMCIAVLAGLTLLFAGLTARRLNGSESLG